MANLKNKRKITISLKVLIVVLLIIISSIPCFLVKELVVKAYEDRAILKSQGVNMQPEKRKSSQQTLLAVSQYNVSSYT